MLNHLIYLYQSNHSSEKIPAPKVKPLNFLPFPEVFDKPEEQLLEPKTKELLNLLFRSRRIPDYVYKALSEPPTNPPPQQ
jgi:hypothetical protein